MRKPLGARGTHRGQYNDPTARSRKEFDVWRDRQRDKIKRKNVVDTK